MLPRLNSKSPVKVWIHYVTLLFVVVAIASLIEGIIAGSIGGTALWGFIAWCNIMYFIGFKA